MAEGINGTLTIEVTIGDQWGGHLRLRESIELQAGNMSEHASLLTQFHEFLERIRDEQAGLAK